MQVERAPGGKDPRAYELARLNRDWLRRVARWPGVTAWLASDRPAVEPTSDHFVPFTRALLAGLGDRERKQSLAACLRTLQLDSQLKAGGFQAIGGAARAESLGRPVRRAAHAAPARDGPPGRSRRPGP